MDNQELHLAEQYLLHTQKSIFLTGKAGTGKTTFLRSSLKKTSKNYIVVAPTGVAAINAGGVTIHSMFQLPSKTFLPTFDFVGDDRFTNWKILPQTQKLKRERRQVLIELDLLIIDEISMVRADLLDAIDFTLRRIRKSTLPFGGVQLLLIGDLFQLSPVVKQADWAELRKYYSNPYFFESNAWKKLVHVSIELKNVYRQADESFISILNQIRNNKLSDDSLSKLNENFEKDSKEKQIITLTTHNYKADKINKQALSNLSGEEHNFSASVTGRFSESAYPASASIKLKVGAQVMFVKNHPDGLYFNGKIGQIKKVADDHLVVSFLDQDSSISVTKEKWENISYQLDPETKKLEQNNIGSFEQYPLRLAWAVTVHKSQGLTFDELILDLEDTFAPGQLYVALSRCRSLDGLHLSSKIKMNNVIVDQRILSFYEGLDSSEDLNNHLDQAKKEYEIYLLVKAFSLEKIMSYAESWDSYLIDSNAPSKGDALVFSKDQQKRIYNIQDIVLKFQKQLDFIFSESKDDFQPAISRMSDAIGFFTKEINNKMIVPLENHIAEWKTKAKSKSYVNNTKILASAFWDHIESLYKLQYREVSVFQGDRILKRTTKLSKARKRAAKGETYKITFDLFKGGKSIKEIAKERDLAIGTIESHMGKFISEGKVKLSQLIEPDRLDKLVHEISDKLDSSATDILKQSQLQMSYSEIRWVRSWLQIQEKKLKEDLP